MLEPVTQPLVLQTLLLATRTMTPLLMALQPATLLVALLLLVRLTTMPLLLVQGLLRTSLVLPALRQVHRV